MDILYFKKCCQYTTDEDNYFGVEVNYLSAWTNGDIVAVTVEGSTICGEVIDYAIPSGSEIYSNPTALINYGSSCSNCVSDYPCVTPTPTPIPNQPQPINECNVVTIFPMEVECVTRNPSSSTADDGYMSVSITGGTPPYTTIWSNGNISPAIENLTIGTYTATVIDYYGDFTATTTCELTHDLDCEFGAVVSNFTTPPTPTPTPAVYNLFEECGGVPCTETNVNYGEQTNPDDIVSNWTRFSFFANDMYPGSNQKSGLQPDGTILSASSLSYLYTGSTKYLGSHNLTMLEGENVGPVPLSQSTTDSGKFYYNTHLNKFVVWYNVAGAAGGWRWSTYNPTQNTGLQYGNPTATRYLTTSTNWTTTSLLSNQYTISGTSDTVVLASDKITNAGGTSKSIKCSQNSGLLNGFYSTCGYVGYQHEVTLESTDNDNDTTGLVLAAIKDDSGLYGPSGQTHTININFNSTSTNGTAKVTFNQNNNTLAFTDGTNYNGTIWRGVSPFGGGNYNNKGSVRVKVIKSGTTFSIYTTDTMGTKSSSNVAPGQSNPYSLLVSFDLTDKTTWTDAPAYAVGDELEIFTGGTKFGYLTSSQSDTYFYDIVFSGSQIANESTMYGLNIPNLTTNQVYKFDEVGGCWTYVGTDNQYNGTTTSLTVDGSYNSCIQCES